MVSNFTVLPEVGLFAVSLALGIDTKLPLVIKCRRKSREGKRHYLADNNFSLFYALLPAPFHVLFYKFWQSTSTTLYLLLTLHVSAG